MKKRLTKSKDKKLFGVAGGVADYFDVDPLLIRVGFVVTTFCFFPFAILGHVALAIMMPSAATATEDLDDADGKV